MKKIIMLVFVLLAGMVLTVGVEDSDMAYAAEDYYCDAYSLKATHHYGATVDVYVNLNSMWGEEVTIRAEENDGTPAGSAKYTVSQAKGTVNITFDKEYAAGTAIYFYIERANGDTSRKAFGKVEACKRCLGDIFVGPKGVYGGVEKDFISGSKVNISIGGDTYTTTVDDSGVFSKSFPREYMEGLKAEVKITCPLGDEVYSRTRNVESETTTFLSANVYEVTAYPGEIQIKLLSKYTIEDFIDNHKGYGTLNDLCVKTPYGIYSYADYGSCSGDVITIKYGKNVSVGSEVSVVYCNSVTGQTISEESSSDDFYSIEVKAVPTSDSKTIIRAKDVTLTVGSIVDIDADLVKFSSEAEKQINIKSIRDIKKYDNSSNPQVACFLPGFETLKKYGKDYAGEECIEKILVSQPLKCLKPGSTTITSMADSPKGDTVLIQFNLTVVPLNSISISKKQLTFTVESIMNYNSKDSEILHVFDQLGHDIFPTSWTSSNSNVAKVDEDGRVRCIKKGKAVITAKLSTGKTVTCNVTVKDKNLNVKINKQSSGAKDKHLKGTVYADWKSIDVIINLTDAYRKNAKDGEGIDCIQLFRSNKKKGKYKKVETIKNSYSYHFYMYGSCHVIEDDHKLKANKKYYYKARCKLEGESSWGKLSKPVAYWTAAKPYKGTAKKSGKYVKAHWKKCKRAAGYVYNVDWHYILGYNIFGQSVHWREYKQKFTKKRSVSCFTNSSDVLRATCTVHPITKHGGAYFMDGKRITTKTSSFKDYGGEKFV